MSKDIIKVLHVDDSAIDRELIKDALEKESKGFEVTQAASRQDFESVFAAEKFDIVLSDFNILGFEGLDVIDWVHNRDSELPVIIVTGTGSETLAVEAMKRGAADYTIKTVNHIQRLPYMIQSVLEKTNLRLRQKRAEDALESSEIKYRGLFENASHGIGYYGPDGTVIAYNKKAAWDMNGKPEDFVGKSLTDIFGAKPGKEYSLRIKSACETEETLTFEDDVEIPSGRKCFISSFTRILDAAGEIVGVQVISNDITARKSAEDRLRESEEKYRSLVENSDIGIALIGPGFKVLSLNKQMRSWFPRASASENPICHSEFNSPSRDKPCDYCPVIKTFSDGKVHTAITDTPTPDGVRNYRVVASPIFDSDGKVTSVIESVEDYTDQMKAERKLRESEEKFRSYVDRAPNGIFVVDINGFYIDANRSAESMTGYTREELLKKHILDMIPDSARDDAKRHFELLRARGASSSELPFIKKDGTIGYWLVDAVSLGNNKYIGFVNDITETRRLRDLEERARRLETAGTIAGQVAHDFNNLLAPIMAYPEFIREELPPDHHALSYLSDIENAAQKMADINQDLLTMSRRGHYSLETLNLNNIIQPVIKEMGYRSANVTYDIGLNSDLMNIKGGVSQIHRMLINILNNAHDAMQDVGNITVKTENYYADDTSIAYGQVPRGEYIKLTISDTGCGIPEEIRQKIFDPFFSTKLADKKRGSGLGMSIVDAVMKDHNGYLDLKSEVGRGTSFFLYFPVCRDEIDSDSNIKNLFGSEKVLIIDDDEIQRGVTRKMVEKLGYNVSVAEGGTQAIEMVKNNDFDILILDMIMPNGLDGTETYRKITELNPDQKAIIVSGYSESGKVLETQKLGAGTFVRKPLTKISIAKALRKELDNVTQPL